MAAAIPLYLLKIEMVPREAAWLPSLLFVALPVPGPAGLRLGLRPGRAPRGPPALGLAGGRAGWRCSRSPRLYVLIVFLAQYTSWGGSWSLYEQHAFLLPVPFLGY